MAKYKLPERDIAFLDSLGTKWEAGSEGGMGYVIIYNVGIDTDYYTIKGAGDKMNILLMLPPGYPNSQIDMASFYPHLQAADGHNIPNLHYTFYKVKGNEWQTWSRHRTGGDYWNPETDGIASHLAYIDLFLQREVGFHSPEPVSSHLISTFVKKLGSGMKMLRFPEKSEKSKEKSRLIIHMG